MRNDGQKTEQSALAVAGRNELYPAHLKKRLGPIDKTSWKVQSFDYPSVPSQFKVYGLFLEEVLTKVFEVRTEREINMPSIDSMKSLY